MDDDTKKQYLADDPPTVARLEIKPHFLALNATEQKYAHYISRASLAGTRINLRQVSPESEPIYDFILALYEHCNGTYLLASRAGMAQLQFSIAPGCRLSVLSWSCHTARDDRVCANRVQGSGRSSSQMLEYRSKTLHIS